MGGDAFGSDREPYVQRIDQDRNMKAGLRKKEPTHIDDWCTDLMWQFGPEADQEPHRAYAMWFFFCYRLSAALKLFFKDFMPTQPLFCDYAGQRYRVTGCSRLGDVWLTTDFKQEMGYELRVDVDNCARWGVEP